MSAFKSHSIHASVHQLVELIERPEFAEPAVTDDERALGAHDKIAGVARALEDLLETTPPAVVAIPAIDQINNNLQVPISEVSQFLGNKNIGHLLNAASYIDSNITSYFWGFAARPSEVGAARYARKVEEFSQESIRNIAAQRDLLITEVEGLRKKAAESEAKLTQLLESVSRDRSSAAAAVSNLDLQFSERERERTNKFEEALELIQGNARVLQESIKEESASTLEDTQRIRNDAARILGVVGDMGITTNFGKIAEAEARQADNWRRITVCLFMVGIGLAVATFARFYFSDITAVTAIAIGVRLLYALAVTAPAWYTARESARHRSNADRARQTELELAALGPFIELMDKPKKDEIKEKLTERYFGRPVESHLVRGPISTRQLRVLVLEIIKAIKPGK
ncbi:hypothetical protein [Lysobacter capsici]|uniref:hypothetical protein n=1 Tax=Lysobacter capsici TaxID=435897 RepID=UPI001C0002CE|nr:hypothetical protein [Lysobacter capsici]QWF16389.1 hypothetical protein KME82_21950 [Lysobacter capsici]